MQSVSIVTKVVSSNPVHDEVYSIQHCVIKFVSDLRQVSGFVRVLRFPPPIKLTDTISWNIVESGVKHHISLSLSLSNIWFRKFPIIMTSSWELRPNAGQIEVKTGIHVTVFAILWRLDLYSARYTFLNIYWILIIDSFSYIATIVA
jgi:hypothetical protein